MESIEIILDKILNRLYQSEDKYLYKGATEDKWDEFFKSINIKTEIDLKEILSILQDDKYIEFELSEARIGEYQTVANIRLTLKGVFWVQSGGYRGSNNLKNRLQYQVKMVQNITLFLSASIALGTLIAALYYLSQLSPSVHYYFHHCCH